MLCNSPEQHNFLLHHGGILNHARFPTYVLPTAWDMCFGFKLSRLGPIILPTAFIALILVSMAVKHNNILLNLITGCLYWLTTCFGQLHDHPRSIRANVYIHIPCNEVFLWDVMGSHYDLQCSVYGYCILQLLE